MAAAKKDADGDVGQKEAQRLNDKAEEKGFIGRKVDPLPNSAYSQEGGPPEAGTFENDRTRVVQHAADPED